MTDDHKAYQATPNATLEQRIMSPHMPKSEAEHWAKREIERLRAMVRVNGLMAGHSHEDIDKALAETVAL